MAEDFPAKPEQQQKYSKTFHPLGRKVAVWGEGLPAWALDEGPAGYRPPATLV